MLKSLTVHESMFKGLYRIVESRCHGSAPADTGIGRLVSFGYLFPLVDSGVLVQRYNPITGETDTLDASLRDWQRKIESIEQYASACEDYPHCGHEWGFCPDGDTYYCIGCHAVLAENAVSSLCVRCIGTE